MTNRTKRSNKSKTQGRQNAFSGIKLAFLESYKDQFLESTDRGGFYTMVAKNFLERFGYTLPIEEDPPANNGSVDANDGSVDATGEKDPALQTVEEQDRDNEERNKIYRDLREKLGCWFRYRYTSKNTNQSYINNIIERIMSSSATRPRKKSAMKIYTDTNKTQLNHDFNKRWDTVKDTMQSRDRIGAWTEFVKDRWEKESPAVRDEIVKQADKENATQFKEWKQKAAFAGTPEDLDKAWKMSENILPTFADAMAEWLGANIVILAVAPLGSSDGEIVIRSAQSDISRGMTKKLVSEFDPEGWGKAQQTMLAHGKAYFPPEECRRRVIKNEESGTEPLDEDARMDNASTNSSDSAAASTNSNSSATSLSASAAPQPPSLAVPDATTGDLTTPLIPSPALCTQQPHVSLLPLIDSAAKHPPSGDVSIIDNGLYIFPVNSADSCQWSDACVPSLSQPVDDDTFPLSLPFQPTTSATLTPVHPALDLGSFATIAEQTAAVGSFATTVSTVPPSAMPPLIPSLTFSSEQTAAFGSSATIVSTVPPSAMPPLIPSLTFSPEQTAAVGSSATTASTVPPSAMPPLIPSLTFSPSETPSLAFSPSETPSLDSDQQALQIPSSETPSSVMPSLVPPSSGTPCLVGQSPMNTIYSFPPNEPHPTNTLTIEGSPNGATMTSAGLPLVTTNSVNTLSAMSASDNLCGKENTKAVEVITLDAKKRKGDINSVKPQRKRVKEDNSMTVDMHAAQEKAAPGENGAPEAAATRSGRKSNLPNHLKDAGYAPPKRAARKKDD